MKFAHKSFWVFLGLLLAARLAVMTVTPVFDPSESRYAVLAANMADSGDFVMPQFTHEGRRQSFQGKPPLLFQMGGVACKALGRSELAVRLPSFLAFALLLVIVFRTVKKIKDDESACAAVAATAGSTALYAIAGFCMTDMLLVLSVAGAILLYLQHAQGASRWAGYGVFALLGMGMLVKGPIAVALFGLSVLVWTALDKRGRALRTLPWFGGILLFLAIAVPWYALMTIRDPGFPRYFFINENLLRFLVHDYGDRYGAGRETFRGMAAVWFVVSTLPWCLFVIRSFTRRPWIIPPGLLSAGKLCFVSCTAITCFWCLTSRVPLTYLAPTIPLFAVYLALHDRPGLILRVFPAVAAGAILVLCGTLLFTVLRTDKLPGRFFADIRTELGQGARVAFLGRQPYSAEFYMPGLLASTNAPNVHLLVSTRKLKRKGDQGRPHLRAANGWTLLGPMRGNGK